MKKKLKIIIPLILIFLAPFILYRGKIREKKFKVTEQKPFAIIIPSYNNSRFCERNLRSVLDQNYENFRIIYIDDCSTDDTYEKVKNYLLNQPIKATLIHNNANKGALANLYDAIHSCSNEEIILTLDGDDFLAHDNVLTKLNEVYANPKVWLTYGNFVDYPTYTQDPVICKKLTKLHSFRKQEWVTSHLRTFYAGLFKKIKLEDLLYQGKFFPMAWDLPMMFPMLEMAGDHIFFVKDVLYLYNRENPLNDHKVNVRLQAECAQYARSLTPYKKLKTL